MRISDWSSDVCSSDLSSLTNVALLRTTAMLAKTRGFAAQTGDKVVPLSLIKRTQCYRGDGRGPVSRSEEHTSELQPLMRTSYAVFCLKKKKSRANKHIKKRDISLHHTYKVTNKR